MQLDTFKFYIRKYDTIGAQWYYYFVNGSGVVATTTTKTALPQAPDGWQDTELRRERGWTYYGVFTSYSNPLRFVKDGGTILKWFYYNYGIDAVCELLIEKHTKEVSTWGYVEYYRGDFDFSQFKDEKDYTGITIMQGGSLAELKAKEATDYEIPIEQNADVIWVKMDGIDLQFSTDFTFLPNEVVPDLGIDARIPTMIYLAGLDKGQNFYLKFKDNFNDPSGPVYFAYNYSTTQTQSFDLVHSFNYNVYVSPSGATAQFVIQYITFDDNYAIVGTNNAYTGVAVVPGASQTYTDTITDTITLQPGYSVAMVIRMFNTLYTAPMNVTKWDLTQLGSEFDITLLNKYPTTYIPALRPITVAQAMTDNITAGWTMNAPPLTDFEQYVITSGDALRNLSESVLKTNWQDMYKAFDCMFNTAFYQDEANFDLYIDYKDNLFDSVSAAIDLGDAAELKITPFTQEMFSKLMIGYKPYSYDEYNGKEEFNTEYTFQAPTKRVTNAKDLISTYRADMYGIELTRANLTDKIEADSDNDNEVFWLAIETTSAGTVPSGPGAGEPYYELDRALNADIQSGLISPTTAFNILLSPKRRMRTWGNWLKSIFYPVTSTLLSFTSSQKSINGGGGLEWDDGVTVINEKDNEVVSGLPGNLFFYPLIFEVTLKVPLNPSTVFSTPYVQFSFDYKGLTLYGWLIEVSDKPAFRMGQEYKLLCSQNNTLTDLINLQ